MANSSLHARRIWAVRRSLVAAPAYLDRHSRLERPDDPAGHACLSYAYLPSAGRWRFVWVDGAEAVVAPTGPMRANNAEALTPALRAGLGLAVQPDFMIWDDLASGRLVLVMPSCHRRRSSSTS